MQSKLQQIQKQNSKQVQEISHENCFVIDIDGTLSISHKQVPGASEGLNYLDQNKIPFILLTNNISHSESTLANELNSILKLNTPLTSQKIILNYTPTRELLDWENRNVLLVGRQIRFKQILPIDHIKKYVTIQEYCTIFPELVPLGRRKFDQNAIQIKQKVQSRLNMGPLTKQNLKFGVILIISCPVSWQQSLQVIIDLLNSQDGAYPSHKTTYEYVPNHIPVIATIDDFLYSVANVSLPRILIRPFNNMLKSTFQQLYKHPLNITIFGKPNPLVYRYSEKHCAKLFGSGIKKFTMIGDNPEVDVKGAVDNGWDGILLKSGLAKGDSHLATVNCQSVFVGIIQYLKIKSQRRTT